MSAGASAKIRLLLVDDRFFARLGLAEADNGTQAIKLFREHLPDVVLLDGRLPGLSGTEPLTALRHEFPKARVLMLSISAGNEDVHWALQAGAAGYVSKATQLQELLPAMRHSPRRTPLPFDPGTRLPLRSGIGERFLSLNGRSKKRLASGNKGCAQFSRRIENG